MIITKAIVTAMAEEAELIIEKYNLQEKEQFGTLKIFEGERAGEDDGKEHIVLVLCGVGKIYSAMATTYLLENYDPEKIINIGIVGNLSPSILSIGDVILPNCFMQHDVYIPKEIDNLSYLRDPIFVEYAIGEEYDLEKFKIHLSGICVTGDQFIDNEDLKQELKENFSADIVDMEAYSFLTVLKNYDKLDRAVVIKSVSDGADNSAATDHVSNLDIAMKNAVAILDFTL